MRFLAKQYLFVSKNFIHNLRKIYEEKEKGILHIIQNTVFNGIQNQFLAIVDIQFF